MLAHQRAVRNLPRHPLSEDPSSRNAASVSFQRAQDEYESAIARNVDSWAYSTPGRPVGDSPESRRRQIRGRIGNSRAAHLLGRPTSVGSTARWANPASPHGNSPQRMHAAGIPPINPSSGNIPTTRRSVTPCLPRQNSGSSGSTTQTPPGQRHVFGLSPSPPSEEPSPPVAVGSGLASDRQSEPALNRRLNLSTSPPNREWIPDPLRFMLDYQDPDHYNLGQSNRPRPRSNDLPTGSSSIQALLDTSHPLGQHPTSEGGPDVSTYQPGESNRNNDFNSLLPSRWSR